MVIIRNLIVIGLAVISMSACQTEQESAADQEIQHKSNDIAEQEQAYGSEGMGDQVLHHDIMMIDGALQSLELYKGSVLLLVNVASECGLTPQYEGLEALYQKYKDQGLVIIGFPANNFGAQEPGTNEQILEFCTTKFSVSFPMASKISVKGEDAHPLYQQLAAQPEPIGGDPEWNFAKFVIDREGRVVNRFSARTEPMSEELQNSLEELL